MEDCRKSLNSKENVLRSYNLIRDGEQDVCNQNVPTNRGARRGGVLLAPEKRLWGLAAGKKAGQFPFRCVEGVRSNGG